MVIRKGRTNKELFEWISIWLSCEQISWVWIGLGKNAVGAARLPRTDAAVRRNEAAVTRVTPEFEANFHSPIFG
jgi:hypothetical protein